MKDLTGQILELRNGKNYFVLKQIEIDNVIYYLGAGITKEEDFTKEYTFLERVNKDGKFSVKEVTDPEILEKLALDVKAD